MRKRLGIRGKLLLLAVGIALPLVIVGALDLRNMWQLSRAQLDDSVKQQVELASVALERWLDDQKKALDAIAALAGDNDSHSRAISENLENVLRTRPFWIDLRVTNAAGTTIVSQPSRKEVLPEALTDYIVSDMRERNSWTVVTDRTMDEARPIVIIAVPIAKGGAVIARIDGAAINQLFDNIELSQQVVISVLDSDGRVIYRRRGSEAATEAEVSWAPLSSVLIGERTNVVELTSPIDGVKRVYGVAHIRDTGLIAMIGIPSSTLYEPASRRLNRYTLIGLVALLLAIGAALVIERSIVQPVWRLRTTAQQLGGGDLTARAPTDEAGEIGDLALAFNAMAEQVKEREERLTELDQLKSDFVSSVSHELKTPLTTIKVLAHLLRRDDVGEDDRVDYSKTIATECDRQIEFVGNLLDLSRIESGAYKLTKRPVDIVNLLEGCVEIENYRAESVGIELVTKLPSPPLFVDADSEALRRVVRGMIDNAIKYTPAGGRVSVSAQLVQEYVEISIEDTGIGIALTDLPHVFNKFYRAKSFAETDKGQPDESGTLGTGVGLGLYLAKHVIEHLGGQLEVANKNRCGTMFKIILPVSIEKNASLEGKERTDVEAIANS